MYRGFNLVTMFSNLKVTSGLEFTNIFYGRSDWTLLYYVRHFISWNFERSIYVQGK